MRETIKAKRKGAKVGVETPLDRVNRDLAILNMRLHGLSYYEIARKLPEAGFREVTASGVFAVVTRSLRSLPNQAARELRQLELLRLDQLQAAHYQAAMGGDVQAIARVLSIMDRRVRLLGFDAAEAAPPLDEARASLLKKLEHLSLKKSGTAKADDAQDKA